MGASGTGVVVDVDADSIAMWLPYFCPDEDNLPEGIFDLKARFADPFEALLNDADEAFDNVENRLINLMIAYDVEAPTRGARGRRVPGRRAHPLKSRSLKTRQAPGDPPNR